MSCLYDFMNLSGLIIIFSNGIIKIVFNVQGCLYENIDWSRR